MSFDRTNQPPQQAAANEAVPRLQESAWPTNYPPPPRTSPPPPEEWDMYGRPLPSAPYPGNSLPPPQPASQQHQQYAYPTQQEAYPAAPPSLPQATAGGSGASPVWERQYGERVHPGHYMPSRDIPQPPPSHTQQMSSPNPSPFDPVRNSTIQDTDNHGSVAKDTLPPPPIPSFKDRASGSSPAMSISQLLSSDNYSLPPLAAPTPTSSAQLRQSEPSAPLHVEELPVPAHPPSSFRSGIRNLLNSDTEDAYQMADSDTDTEDIPLIRTADNNVVPISHHTTSNGFGSLSALTGSQSGRFESLDQRQREVTPALPDDLKDAHNPYDDTSDDSLDDFGDGEDDNVPRGKSLVEKTMEELQLSDDDDEDELLQLRKDEMVKFMLRVHRRKKRVIDEYEQKRALKHTKITGHLESLYEKRYGVRMPKQLIGSTPSLSAEMLRKAGKTDRKRKRRAKRHDLDSGDDASDDSRRDMFLDPARAKTLSQRKLDDERKKIWLSIARKDIPRMARILTRVQATRAGNCKKIAQYCQKESRRAATKGGRISKDVQAKARRAMKEMLLFWKKNEKEEKELRKKAEKEALDRLRMEEERREAQRQARKLNFLITQTELYSHFIGRKIKQDTGDDDETAVPQSDSSTPAPSEEVHLDTSAGEQELEAVDFDDDDEEKLKEQARLGAQNALARQREQTRVFDEGARKRRHEAGGASTEMSLDQGDLDTMNFQDPTTMGSGPEVQQPALLNCQLKNYQLKGLNWLANLYEQGINGILADEMGLGKTVQSISLMAYLAEVHNIWGPFLVVAPASTLHNWQKEIEKFVPTFKALPYWGNAKERKSLRQFWNRKHIYGRDSPFQIIITSYQLVLSDVSYFQRVKWQYMILDEAQAIKSSTSARWKQLLGFHCRNRLLLTGTPIQNNMQELWALLHFIMPTLFDSHEEFSEWFSKGIENHAENKGTLNEHQLKRLHMILKPFMLRRIKRNVQHELGEKIEVELYCDLTSRQRKLYRGLKEKISISELLEKASSLNEIEGMDSLMNLVMQFRKVCNHPELFERADVQAPLAFCRFSQTGPSPKEAILRCPYSSQSHIQFHIPKRLYRNGGILRTVGPESKAGFTTRYLDNLMNIWTGDVIHESMFSSEPDAAFSFLRFADMSPHEASSLFRKSLLARWMYHLARQDQRARRRFYIRPGESYPDAPVNTYASFLVADTVSPTCTLTLTPGGALDELTHVADKTIHEASIFDECYIPGARAVPVDIICSDVGFEREQRDMLFDPTIRACLFGRPRHVRHDAREEAADLTSVVRRSEGQGVMTIPATGHGYSLMKIPAMRDLIMDCGKLAALDQLLVKLKAEGHRCLLYFQMTRMIDLMEEYITYKQYKYLRLDGSSKLSDRRDMVQDWQTRPEIFLFLLSARAGGLGINLTAADTVIFYDSDWNPTIDLQAMDRAHRIGQTKQVTVYRLITKGTIEERILLRAKQKDEIQKTVIDGGDFKDRRELKDRKEIMSLLLDDDELASKQQLEALPGTEPEPEASEQPPTKRPRANASKKNTNNNNQNASNTKIGRPRTNFSFTG